MFNVLRYLFIEVSFYFIMKIIITAKTKNHNHNGKELDKSVDVVMAITNKLEYDIKSCRCYKDGTSLILGK